MYFKNVQQQKRHVFLLTIPLFLSACLGDEPIKNGISKNPPLKPPLLNVINVISTIDAAKATPQLISLASSVEDHDGVGLSLEKVVRLSENCPEPIDLIPEQITYRLKADLPQICAYAYTIKSKGSNGSEKESTGVNFVLITDDTNKDNSVSFFPNFNYTDKSKENAGIEIDIMKELKKVGVSLSSLDTLNEDVIVFGKGTATGLPSNRILYLPDGVSPYTRLFYTVTLETGEQKAGNIDLFIEQENNALPLANNFTYAFPVNTGDRINAINVEKFISDSDGDTLVLSAVSTFNAFVSLSKESSCKTCFDFKAFQEGEFKVNYLISDQREGYGSATVTIKVMNPWQDISNPLSSKGFSATPDERTAKNEALSFSNVDKYQLEGDLQINIPRFTYDVANAYCAKQEKRLPFEQELVALFEQRGQNLFVTDKWPVTAPYWIFRNTKEAFSLENGLLLEGRQDAFVTCTDFGMTDIVVSPLNLNLRKQEAFQFVAKGIYENDIISDITSPLDWTSSHSQIASIDKKGKLTAHVVGKTEISASTTQITSQKSASVIVFELNDIHITQDIIQPIHPKTMHQLTAKPLYTDGIIPSVLSEISWRSDDPKVAAIDGKGLLTAHATGITSIYAKIGDVESKSPLSVNVLEAKPLFIGVKGPQVQYIDPSKNKKVSFYGNYLIDGIYDETGTSLIAGGRGGQALPGIMDFAEITEMSAYTAVYNGIRGLSKLSWKTKDGKEHHVGQHFNQLDIEFAGRILIDTPINRLTVNISGYSTGYVTGLQIN